MSRPTILPSKRDRHEFCYMYRHLFYEIYPVDNFTNPDNKPIIREIAELARKWFNYSPTYFYRDIVWSLRFKYLELI